MYAKVACVALLAVFAVTNASLLDALKAVHANAAFNNLTASEQILIVELIAEVEIGELKAYVDHVGFHNVLAIIDKLPAAEAHILSNYLTQELQKEEHMSAVGKRDLTTVLQNAMANPEFQNLSPADQEFVKKMITAAENHQLMAFVQNVGYSHVLQLLDSLPTKENHDFSHYLAQGVTLLHYTGELKAYIDHVGFHHVLAVIDKLPATEAHRLNGLLTQELQKEEHMSAVGKRDLTTVLKNVMGNPEFQNLSPTDQEFVKKMITAAENHQLMAFVQNVGYSHILQLLDSLPMKENHDFSQYLPQHLKGEILPSV